MQSATAIHAGIGGTTSMLKIDGQKVFVKKIALTDLERAPENFLSTANLFKLPLFYHYRLGSAGFNAWRELEAHKQTTDWALSGACISFPLLYHWRVLEKEKNAALTDSEATDLRDSVKFWSNSAAVKNRLEALHSASANLVLFTEYIPKTLHDWLSAELEKGGDIADQAVAMVERECLAVATFFENNQFVHFDAHFNNILCNGNLFVSDFGLALSSQYNLEQAEIDFSNKHRTYDRAVCIVSLIQCLLLSLYGPGKWIDHLEMFGDSKIKRPAQITPLIEATIQRYSAIAFVLNDFYQQLQNGACPEAS